jgi:arylsulfatase A-like enzyme
MSEARDHVFKIQNAALWAGMGVLSLALYVAVPRSAWHDSLLPLASRLGLAGIELVLLAVLCMILALGLSWYTVHYGDWKPVWQRLAGGIVLGFGWLFLLAYLASWAALHSTGRFLDSVTVLLFGANAVQMIQHAAQMDPVLLIALPVLAFALAAGVTVALPRLAMKASPKTARIASVSALFAVAGCAVLAGAGSRYTVTQMYKGAFGQTGPLTSLGQDLATQISFRSDPVWSAQIVPLEQRPAVAMEEYLNGVEPAYRRNIVVVVVESLRNDQLQATGGEREVMGVVDSIARFSRVFTRNYTQSSHSDYADLAIFSSHYPLRSPRYHMYPKNPTYPRVLVYDVLKGLGYRTGVFSSQNESWSGMINYLDTGNIDRLLHADTYDGPTYVPRNDQFFYRWVKGSKRAGKIDDRFTVGEAIEWIDGLGDQPFFAYVNLQSSHVPYEIPADFPVKYGTGRVSFPLQFAYFPPDSVAAVKDLYANSLAYVDAQIARLVAHLQETGRWENTIFVVTGDTGQAFFEHGFAGHANALYDEVMRVPLVIRSPGLEPGVDVRLSQHVDVPPSLLHLIGVPPHPAFQGRNLFTESTGEQRFAYLLAQAAAHQYAIVDARYKLIYDATRRRYLLYDLNEDPGEIRDISAEREDIVGSLAARLHAWRRAQLGFYSDVRLHGDWYPPVLPESL